ncbi:hypothetical protein B7W89_08670 [Agrobacterium tumefaciens]|nr:hypothetical protein B7W89_08670 [Agrobacterium tumefaciens]
MGNTGAQSACQPPSFEVTRISLLPLFLCLSQESSRRASAGGKDSFQPKDLGWLDSCAKHSNEGGEKAAIPPARRLSTTSARPFSKNGGNRFCIG